MERINLGRRVQFQGDSGGCHIGQVLCGSNGIELRMMWHGISNRLIRLHDTGDIVLVDNERLQANVPNPPFPAETESWHDMMEELANLPEHGD